MAALLKAILQTIFYVSRAATSLIRKQKSSVSRLVNPALLFRKGYQLKKRGRSSSLSGTSDESFSRMSPVIVANSKICLAKSHNRQAVMIAVLECP